MSGQVHTRVDHSGLLSWRGIRQATNQTATDFRALSSSWARGLLPQRFQSNEGHSDHLQRVLLVPRAASFSYVCSRCRDIFERTRPTNIALSPSQTPRVLVCRVDLSSCFSLLFDAPKSGYVKCSAECGARNRVVPKGVKHGSSQIFGLGLEPMSARCGRNSRGSARKSE